MAHEQPNAEPVLCDARATAPPERALDYDDLMERCMGHLRLVEQLLASYEEKFWPQIDQIEAALREGDASRVAELAHRLKGASANISAVRLRELLHQVEDYSRSGTLAPIAECLQQMHAEWEAFVRCRAAVIASAPRDLA